MVLPGWLGRRRHRQNVEHLGAVGLVGTLAALVEPAVVPLQPDLAQAEMPLVVPAPGALVDLAWLLTAQAAAPADVTAGVTLRPARNRPPGHGRRPGRSAGDDHLSGNRCSHRLGFSARTWAN